MDAAEYKHVVLGLIFLKNISDAFEERHGRLEAERDQGAPTRKTPTSERATFQHVFDIAKVEQRPGDIPVISSTRPSGSDHIAHLGVDNHSQG